MAVIRALIVDDEAPARSKLRRMLAAEGDFEVVGEASSGEEAVASLRDHAVDVVFLDVQMPGLSGFDVVQALGENVPRVVFVTAHDAHAIQAFEVRAVDYLLKPVTSRRFRATAERLREQVRSGGGRPGAARSRVVGELREIVAALSARAPHLDRLMVHDDTRAHFLPVEQIDWIEADRNYVRIHAGRSTFTDRTTVGALAARLDPAKFLRVNRSQIVRLDAVKEMQPWSHGDYRIVLADGTVLTWSRRYRSVSEAAFKASPSALVIRKAPHGA